jgi:hypothetical protein
MFEPNSTPRGSRIELEFKFRHGLQLIFGGAAQDGASSVPAGVCAIALSASDESFTFGGIGLVAMPKTCPNCGRRMTFARHVPLPTGHDQEVWECKTCKVIATEPATPDVSSAA